MTIEPNAMKRLPPADGRVLRLTLPADRRSLAFRLGIWVAAVLALLTAAIAVTIIWWCDGHLIYSLDDPYISLSLGRHIAQGEYGINAGEGSSPASSILFPLLLAAFGWTSWQVFVPFAVNAAAALGTGLMLVAAACRYGIVTGREQLAAAAAATAILCLALNTIGVVFTGLEHSLHALTSVVVVLGLAAAIDRDRASPILLVAIVLLPLWRFEGCALALLAVLALALLRQPRAALLSAGGIAATLGAYFLAMHALGLPFLPSSVLSKSEIAKDLVGRSLGAGSVLHLMLGNLLHSYHREAVPIFALLGIIAAHAVLRALRVVGPVADGWSRWQETVFAGVVAGALCAHVLFGNWGAFLRYSGYAAALGTAGAIVLWQRQLAAMMHRRHPLVLALALVLVLNAGLLYLVATLETPIAARGTYEQQYQMRRFAIDHYRLPVAVNDLGLVSHGNPNYVLDLWGLGSEAARLAQQNEASDPDWIGRVARDHRIGLAMIYADKFAGRLPPEWRPLAELYAPHYIATELRTVTFFATSAATEPAALAALRAFGRDLPAGVSLTLLAGKPTSAAVDGRQ